tara:strand:+ start:281 stop:430 length:150 start_codon:yes stop_codon:yes gene_type:complete
LLVYDITKRDTFAALDSISEEIKSKAPAEIKVILVGNKTDIVNANAEAR